MTTILSMMQPHPIHIYLYGFPMYSNNVDIIQQQEYLYSKQLYVRILSWVLMRIRQQALVYRIPLVMPRFITMTFTRVLLCIYNQLLWI